MLPLIFVCVRYVGISTIHIKMVLGEKEKKAWFEAAEKGQPSKLQKLLTEHGQEIIDLKEKVKTSIHHIFVN